MQTNDKQAWERAVEIDESIREKGKKGTQLYIHRSGIPLKLIDFSKQAKNTIDPMSVGECEGMCGL